MEKATGKRAIGKFSGAGGMLRPCMVDRRHHCLYELRWLTPLSIQIVVAARLVVQVRKWASRKFLL